MVWESADRLVISPLLHGWNLKRTRTIAKVFFGFVTFRELSPFLIILWNEFNFARGCALRLSGEVQKSLSSPSVRKQASDYVHLLCSGYMK